MPEPKFSVILPIYKVENYITKAIDSILNQSFTDFELICIDDASPDNSAKITEKYALKDSRVIIIHHEKNKGLGAARNSGVSIASGQYLCCVDSDDWLEKDFLKKVAEKFESDNIDSVWTKYWHYFENQDTAGIATNYPCLAHYIDGNLTITPNNINDFPAYAWNKIYKTNLIKQNQYKWPENIFFEDIYFYYVYFINHPNVFVIDENLYFYRQRKGSITNNMYSQQKISDMNTICNLVNKYVTDQALNTDWSESIQNLGKRFSAQCRNKFIS